MKKISLLVLTAVLITASAAAQISFGSSSSNSSTSASLNISKPSGVSEGDVMIVNIVQRNNGTTAPSLAGWTPISNGVIDGGSTMGALLYKVAGASEPASYTFALGTGANNNVGTIASFSGVDVSGPTPFDTPPGSLSLSNSSSSNATAAGISTNSPNAAVVMFAMLNDNKSMSSWSTTSPGSLTEIYEDQYNGSGNNDLTVGAAMQIKSSNGPTGNGTVSLGTSMRWGAILIALKPAPYATLSPSASQSINEGGTVNFTATAFNFGGSGDYTYTWSAPGASIPGSNPNTIAASNDSKTLTYPTAGTYTVFVTITRSGSAGATTNVTTVTVLPPPNSPLGCNGQFFVSHGSSGDANSTTSMKSLSFSGSTITANNFNINPTGIGFNALGLNPLDGYMYGVRYAPAHLVKIGNGTPGNVNDLGTITNANLSSSDQVFAGCFDANGTYYFTSTANEFYSISGINSPSVVLAATYISAFSLGSDYFIDLAVDPTDGQMYGISGTGSTKTLYKINKTTGALTSVGAITGSNYVAAMFFDEVGNLYGYRADGTFQKIDKTNATQTSAGTGPSYSYADGCSCSFGRVFHDLDFTATPANEVCPTAINPNPSFPLVVSVTNQSATQHTGLTYTLDISDSKKRFRFTESAATIKSNLIAAGVATAGSTVTLSTVAPATGTNYNKIVVTNFQTGLATQTLSFTLQAQLYTLGGPYDPVPLQSVISGLPATLGNTDLSNDPSTIAPDDPTTISFCPNITLPVNLLSFNAKRNGTTAQLSWATASEQNNKGFYIERMSNVSDGWEEIGFVASSAQNGTSSQQISYSYNDPNNSKTVTQYRLRQVDLDTKSKYSDVRSVLGLTESKGLLVYPNPSENGTVNIVFSESNVIRDIAIIDLSGRTLKQMNGVVNNNIRIDNLQTGMYTLRVVVPATGEQMTEKLVVNKR